MDVHTHISKICHLAALIHRSVAAFVCRKLSFWLAGMFYTLLSECIWFDDSEDDESEQEACDGKCHLL